MRMIDANDLANYANNQVVGITANDIMRFPTVDAEPVKHGRWIGINEYCKKNGYTPSGLGNYYWCSECGKAEPKTSDWCPNCGAKMDGGAV